MDCLGPGAKQSEALGVLLPRLSDPERLDGYLRLSEGLPFDSAVRDAWERSLPLLPAADRQAAFLATYGRLRFDDARLALVAAHPELLDQVSAAQRQALFEQLSFPDTDKARALGVPGR